MQTERVTFLTTPDHKAGLARRAAAQGISVGEYVRRKTDEDDELTPEQEAELVMLVAHVNEAIPQMAATLDAMIDTVRHTREEIAGTLDRLDRSE
ncbi:hypothetical protein [Sphingomonas oligophenolica]|uniref:Uncharacterized protein n=1 Tax=Sphingomonas oligophenolica TaxID=301154 RepID=A0A502CEA5_9SPHN|nr:hypothetical protein [Sphingomonas oligophenolica]TPG10980.1 hypothetical protein EAH84_11720 [Sphingomonas oligophenolica]